MRRVEIVEEKKSQRRWVVIDRATREPLLRLHDQDLLRKICRELGWDISNPLRANQPD